MNRKTFGFMFLFLTYLSILCFLPAPVIPSPIKATPISMRKGGSFLFPEFSQGFYSKEDTRIPPFQPKADKTMEEPDFYVPIPIPFSFNPAPTSEDGNHETQTNEIHGARQRRDIFDNDRYFHRDHHSNFFDRSSAFADRHRHQSTSFDSRRSYMLGQNLRRAIFGLKHNIIRGLKSLVGNPHYHLRQHRPFGRDYRNYGSCQSRPCRSVGHAIDSFFKGGFLGK